MPVYIPSFFTQMQLLTNGLSVVGSIMFGIKYCPNLIQIFEVYS